MPAKNYAVKVNDPNKDVCIIYNAGNANIVQAKIRVDQKEQATDSDNQPLRPDKPFNLGTVKEVSGKQVMLLATLAPNPAVNNKELVLSFSLVNAKQVGSAKQTLSSINYNNGYDLFEVTLSII